MERKEIQGREEAKEIIVLDEGIEIGVADGPEWACCWVTIMPLRW